MIKRIHTPGEEWPPLTMTTVEAADISNADRARMRSADLNHAWFDARAAEIYEANRGKWICVAGQQLFSADTHAEVTALAEAAHPEEVGSFTRYVRRKEEIRTHVNFRLVVPG